MRTKATKTKVVTPRPRPPVPRKSYSIQEFAAMHGISERTCERMIERGEIASFKLGNRLVRISVAEAARFEQ